MKVTDYLAIYAAALSTFVFFWNIAKSRPKVRIDAMPGVNDEGGDVQMGVFLIVCNISSHTVHLAGMDVVYEYKSATFKEKLSHFMKFRKLPVRVGWVHSSLSNFGVEDSCPKSLEPWQSHSVFMPDSALAKIREDSISRKMRGMVQDQLGKNTYSRILKIDWEPANNQT